jgi:hypothetical protein
MKWFFRWMDKKMRTIRYEDRARETANEYNGYSSNSVNTALLGAIGLSFTVYVASGGHVVEFRNEDSDGANQMRLYLVNDTEDFAKQIAHCVTIEGLRK